MPSGQRLERIQQSPNYTNGSFQNVVPTEMMLKDISYFKMMRMFFNKPKTVKPPKPLPSVRTDLHTINDDQPVIVWFGHSSYFIKHKGTSILIDPVFSGNASPFSSSVKAFEGTNVYGVDDMPAIDMLILTHDHYDHLDYKTLLKLLPKVGHIYTSMGVGAHLEHWGIPHNKFTEFDWWQHNKISDAISLTATPSRHFSGRLFKRGQSLWSAFILELNGHKLFLGGDSGYDTTFKTIGEKYGPFDIAILECGQYGVHWPYIHMTPEQTVVAATDLNAKILLPIHWGKFALAFHDWDDSIKRVTAAAQTKGVPITTPRIGEPVVLNTSYPDGRWWED